MGFFKEFKEDFSDAVDELIPGGNADAAEPEDVLVDTIDEDIDIDSELSKLDGLLEQAKKADDNVAEAPKAVEPVREERKEEVKKMDTTPVQATVSAPVSTTAAVTDETTVITAGTVLTGSISSTGSIQVQGVVNGDVQCNGKLEITGAIKGNSSSSELFADSAKIEGEVVTTGTAKIGVGTVVIGNISATSAVIAGAVKGDIDVEGPVVVDTSAVVMGNIKSRSVQINNGAVIEGFCSQSYAEVDVERVFAEV